MAIMSELNVKKIRNSDYSAIVKDLDILFPLPPI